MADLLTKEEAALAAQQGWMVKDVFLNPQNRWHVQILPTQFHGLFPHADAASIHVINLARSGQQLAAKALGLVMASHTPPPKGKKK